MVAYGLPLVAKGLRSEWSLCAIPAALPPPSLQLRLPQLPSDEELLSLE